MTTTDLALNGAAKPLARLDPYAGGIAAEEPRVEALAVISCGYRAESAKGSDRPGLPRSSRPNDPQQIHLHDPQGRAPALAEAIVNGEHRRLLIAFPLDDPRQFIIQRFTRYSATRLEAYGDETAMTWIKPADGDNPPQHLRFNAGTAEYERLVKTCKADTRIFFCLAEWGANGPEVVFPDGLGVYAIRTTSRHSVRSIIGSLAYTSKFTRGHIAGLPFLLSVDHREVAGPDGNKRNIPVWTITTKPPDGARLSSRTFRDIATTALREGASLMLPAPTEPGLTDFESEGPADIDEPSEQEVLQLASGGLCDYDLYIKAWHAMARGSAWEGSEARASFIGTYTDDRTRSLSQFLQAASEEDAAALVAALGEAVTNERRQRDAATYRRIYGSEEHGTAHDIPMNVATHARDDIPSTSAGASPDVVNGAPADPPPAGAPDTPASRPVIAADSPTRNDLWAEHRRLQNKASELGITTSSLGNRASDDGIAEANETLVNAIREAEAKLTQGEAF